MAKKRATSSEIRADSHCTGTHSFGDQGGLTVLGLTASEMRADSLYWDSQLPRSGGTLTVLGLIWSLKCVDLSGLTFPRSALFLLPVHP